MESQTPIDSVQVDSKWGTMYTIGTPSGTKRNDYDVKAILI